MRKDSAALTIPLLFWELFKISLLVVGGGYAIIAVADDVFARRGWIKEGELFDRLPVFQMIPGLIATHVGVYIGNKMAGWLGAVVGVIAVATPSVAIFSVVAMGYGSLPLDNQWLNSAFVGLRAGLTGIIAAAIVRSWKKSLTDVFAYFLMLAVIFVVEVLHVNVALALVAAIGMGVLSMPCTARRYNSSLLPLLVFLKYGLLCFGGGFVLVPMYIEDFVGPSASFLNISTGEFADLMSLTQMTPGPIGVNGATFFGYRLAGLSGAVMASALLLLPGSLLCFLAIRSLDKFKASRTVHGIMRGARSASTALMLCALWSFLAMSWIADHDGWSSVKLCGICYNITAVAITAFALIVMIRRKLNVILTIAICALAALTLKAEPDITAAKYPDADVVLVDEFERVKYNVDGTYETTSESWTKILTEKGRRDESTVSLDYSKRYGEAAILYVGAIGEDGVEREIDVSSTTKESTDNSSTAMNIYDPMDRKIVCTIPGLKVGEIVHVKTMRRTLKARCEGKWSDIAVLEWTHPMVKSTFEVISPAGLPLRNVAIRHPLGNIETNVVKCANGDTVYTFCATNSAQVFPEPDMPPLYTQVQHVRVSTAENWPEISRWYWELCVPHLERASPAMTNKVAEIGKDMRAIFKFVSQEVRYMGLTMEDTSPGYSPHDVDITFDNRYGVCRDKAALLVAMLRIAGFEAYPVLIHAGAKLDPEVPQPFFNHAIVAVDTGNCKYQLMDPTDENSKDMFPSYLSDKSYIVCRPDGDGLRTTDIPLPEHNALEVSSTGKVAKDGSIFLENEIRFSGINDNAYRHALVRNKPEERIKFFERKLKCVAPGIELIKCEIEPKDLRDTESPLVVRLASRLPEMILYGDSRDELTVPFVTKALGAANFLLDGSTALTRRKYPLVLCSTARVSETVSLDVSEALGDAKLLPANSNGDMVGYRYVRNFSVTNGMLSANRSLTIGAVEYSPSEYADLREEIKEVEAMERQRPVFDKDLCKDADVCWLENSSETTVFSDSCWVTTNVVMKEILTYNGKKHSAEMKFGFHPAWKNVELVYAVVSNRDGRVYSVSEREQNVMDCGWAAAAPRYPAGKLLVVNLPSVEIGSVISYVVVTTVSNAPAPYYAEFKFDSYEPLVHRRVRVNDWSREVFNPRRLPNEPNQPESSLWRDCVIVSSNRFAKLDLEVAGVDFHLKGLREIRDWMAKYVKVVGPSLYELPIAMQLTDPKTVLRERYATRLDYVRTLCAILRGAGYEADVVLSAADADEPNEVRRRIKFEKPDVRAFSAALCRVKCEKGHYFIGIENQYSPLGPSAYDGCDYFDPATGEFGVIGVPDSSFANFDGERSEYLVRDDGAVDLTVENEMRGSGVGGFRKTYSEILPEERNRRYQTILGCIAQAASATGELETDVDSYPAKRRFSCYIPDFAIVQGDTITIQVPPLISSIPTLTGAARRTPFTVGAEDCESEQVVVRFPRGYVEIEHLPEAFAFCDPAKPGCVWVESEVDAKVEDGAMVVRLSRRVNRRGYTWYSAGFYELVKEWSRIAGSRSNRTIAVRRAKCK